MPLVFADLMTTFSDSYSATSSFGASVAVAADGKKIVMGAASSQSFGIGAAYSSTRANGAWSSLQSISDVTPVPQGAFGASVAISSDGSIILIGEPGINSDDGAVVSVINGTTTGRFYPSDPFTSGYFGTSVAISYDGSTAIVGAPGSTIEQSLQGFTGAPGTAYVFIRSDTVWSQQEKLTSNFVSDNDLFGMSVSISADGNTVVVGAPRAFSFQGTASVFRRSNTTWTETAFIITSDGTPADLFGISVAISADDSTILVGAPGFQTPGKAYVFKNFDNTWLLETAMMLTSNSSAAQFGLSVALSCNGNIALVGAPGYPSSGAAFFFTRSGSKWSTESIRQESNTNYFGQTVALSADGMIALVRLTQGPTYLYRCGYDIPISPCFCCSGGVQGPRGSDGETGPKGVAGIQGPVGPQGFQGPAGANLTAHAYLGQIILFSLMLYGGFFLLFSIITFF